MLPRWLVVLAAIAVGTAATVCLAHSHDTLPDPCLSIVALTIAIGVAVGLVSADRVAFVRTARYDFSPLDLPAPPPKP
ncbi:MAG: hypothetical protein HY002_11060 [Candidatus Rokubacteria bacterium]|nr:hypothetical protein [Candidatus Rokubacteria bacterium]